MFSESAFPSSQRRLHVVAASAGNRGHIAAAAAVAAPAPGPAQEQVYSGLLPQGRAIQNVPPAEYPTMAEVLKAIPSHCFERDTLKSLAYAALSTAMVAGLGLLAYLYIPLQAIPYRGYPPPPRAALRDGAFPATGGCTPHTGCLHPSLDRVRHASRHRGHRLLGASPALARRRRARWGRLPACGGRVLRRVANHPSARPRAQVVAHECGHGAFSDNKLLQAPHPTPPGSSTTHGGNCESSQAAASSGCGCAARRTRWGICSTARCWCPTSRGSAPTRCTTAARTTWMRARRMCP